MFRVSFLLENPFSSLWKDVYWKDSMVSKFKAHELQITLCNEVVGMSLYLSHRCSHAGIIASLSLFGLRVEYSLYDTRHWNGDTNSWDSV